jgi:hypothetical protein
VRFTQLPNNPSPVPFDDSQRLKSYGDREDQLTQQSVYLEAPSLQPFQTAAVSECCLALKHARASKRNNRLREKGPCLSPSLLLHSLANPTAGNRATKGCFDFACSELVIICRIVAHGKKLSKGRVEAVNIIQTWYLQPSLSLLAPHIRFRF